MEQKWGEKEVEEVATKSDEAEVEVEMTEYTVTQHKGMCSSIVIQVFDYGQKESSYQMRTTW